MRLREVFGSAELSNTLIPICLYLGAAIAAFAVGFRSFEIEWNLWQLLDRQALLEDPAGSLLLLHSQPPGLNSLLAFLLWLATETGMSVQVWGLGLFQLIGLLATVLLFRILIAATASLGLAVAGTLISLSAPSFHYYQHILFYPFLVHFFLIFLLFMSLRTIEKPGSSLNWIGTMFAVCLICYTRSLFHLVWAIGYVSVLCLLTAQKGPNNRVQLLRFSTISAIAIAFIIINLWPAKNLWLFNNYTFSTWTGFNLASGTPVKSDRLEDYREYGIVPAAIEKEANDFDALGLQSTRVIQDVTKSTGGRNWNHLLFTKIDSTLSAEAVSYRLSHPRHWIALSVYNYFRWTRPSYVDSYTGVSLGPPSSIYAIYTGLYTRLFYPDLGHFIYPLIPEGLFAPKFPLFTLFGVLTFPLLILLSLMALWDLYHNRSAAFNVMVLAGFTVIWVLLVPGLTDGAEGNRMRFAVIPYLIILGLICLQSLILRFRKRQVRRSLVSV